MEWTGIAAIEHLGSCEPLPRWREPWCGKEEPAKETKAGDQIWEEPKAKIAIFNSGVFRDGLGEYSRALKNREMERFAAKQREVADLLDKGEIEMAEAQLQIEHYWAGALRRAVIDGDVESGSVMAGQSVGMVTREEPVAVIIQELVDEAAAALESRG